MIGEIKLFIDFKSMKEAMGDKTYVSGFMDDPAIFVDGQEISS